MKVEIVPPNEPTVQITFTLKEAQVIQLLLQENVEIPNLFRNSINIPLFMKDQWKEIEKTYMNMGNSPERVNLWGTLKKEGLIK